MLEAVKPKPERFRLLCTDCKKRPRGGAGYASLCVECFVNRMEREKYKTGPKRTAMQASAQEIEDKDMRMALSTPDSELQILDKWEEL